MKKEYTAPEVTVYGNVEEITAGPLNGWLDSIVGADGGWDPRNPPPTSGS